jgi:hypothetical protein
VFGTASFDSGLRLGPDDYGLVVLGTCQKYSLGGGLENGIVKSEVIDAAARQRCVHCGRFKSSRSTVYVQQGQSIKLVHFQSTDLR